MRRAIAAAVAATVALATAGCTKTAMLDFAMASAKEPRSPRGLRVGDRVVLAGDLHCHVLPPDPTWHVSRGLPETLVLAEQEDLDFVVLTPHVPARFYLDDDARAWVLATQAELRAKVLRAHPRATVVVGFEYTDYAYGHVGAAFADVAEVLAEVSAEDAERRPELFFERYLAHGGVLTVNHPVERPLPKAPFRELRADMSWRAFEGGPVPPEIAFITEHAQTIETFNASIAHLRDQFILGDELRSVRVASALLDRRIREQKRVIAPVGGTDSHGDWLRPTTFLLAPERSGATADAIRDALVHGRTCVRGPEGCTLEASADGEAWRGVGDGLRATGPFVRARARGGDVTFLVNDVPVARAASGEVAVVPVPEGRCALLRAIVAGSWSAPIGVDCPFFPGGAP